jgi:general secretion pathway protein G
MNTHLNERRRRPAGFTLIELLVVITIIAILGAVVVPKVMSNPEKARKAAAIADVKALQLQADSYTLDYGRPPSSLQDLVPDYLEEVKADPWGGEYTMESKSDGTVKIRCANLEQRGGLGPSRTDVTIGADN